MNNAVLKERVRFMLVRQDGLFAALPYLHDEVLLEQRLFRRVLDRAVLDMVSDNEETTRALEWVDTLDFELVCEYAGFLSSFVKDAIKKVLDLYEISL